MDADRAAASVTALLGVLLAELGEAGWSSEESGAWAVVTGLPIASMNGVLLLDDCPTNVVNDLLDQVAERVDLYSLQARPAFAPLARSIAEGREMGFSEDVPLMVANPETLHRPAMPAQTVVVALEDDDLDRHTDLATRGFEAPRDIFETITALSARVPGFRAFVSSHDGVDVSTAVTMPSLTSAGVFTVATPPEHRRHGYGAAITAAAARHALDDGAEFVWLQSSEEGFGVYEALGFTTVESWPMWVNAPG